jgi:DNA-binding NarL/FixJ family response regulator
MIMKPSAGSRDVLTTLSKEAANSPPAAISVAIVDSLTVIQEGVRRFLGAHDRFEVAGFGTVEELTCSVPRYVPRVVLLDPRLRNGSAGKSVEVLLASFPNAGVIIYASAITALEILEVSRFGVRGYLPKEATEDELVGAIDVVLAGDSFVHPRLHKQVVDIAMAGGHSSRRLTSREYSVLRLLCEGRTNTELAVDLGITVGTAKVYVSRVLSKLGANDRTQAVVYSLRERLVAPPSID